MRAVCALVLCAITSIALASVSDFAFADSPAVLTANSSNWKSIFTGDNAIFSLFYAPWCPHCQEFHPKFVTLAEEMQSDESPVVFVHVDVDKEAELGTVFQISSFPTIRFIPKVRFFTPLIVAHFVQGSRIDGFTYRGARTLDDMKKWIKARNGIQFIDPVIRLSSDNVTTVINGTHPVALLVQSEGSASSNTCR